MMCTGYITRYEQALTLSSPPAARANTLPHSSFLVIHLTLPHSSFLVIHLTLPHSSFLVIHLTLPHSSFLVIHLNQVLSHHIQLLKCVRMLWVCDVSQMIKNLEIKGIAILMCACHTDNMESFAVMRKFAS
jgi:hypothetical protein